MNMYYNNARWLMKCPLPWKFKTHNLTLSPARSLSLTPKHNIKLFMDIENAHFFKTLPSLGPLTVDLKPGSIKPQELFAILSRNWRQGTASAIVEAFESLRGPCVEHSVPISDPRFNNLVDGLMDNCERLTDEELLRLLQVLSEYPQCESSNSHNFHDVWSCLDDVCCWKMTHWDFDKLYLFSNAWFKLKLGGITDFNSEVLNRAERRAVKLPKRAVLYTYFYLNICRKRGVPFELELKAAEFIHEFTVDELGVIAVGYFKTQSKIKLPVIIEAMYRALRENASTVSEVTLTAILKALRLTSNYATADQLCPLLDQFLPEIPRVSTLCCVHIALAGTGLLIKHEPTIQACTERILKEVDHVRIKDIERMLLVNSIFNQTSELYDLALKELEKEERLPEVLLHQKCLPAALNYLSLRGLYSYKLMNRMLDGEFIDDVFGDSPKELPRELFSLDACIDIECPDYKGSRLEPKKKYKAAKYLTEWPPAYNQNTKLTRADLAFLQIVDNLTVLLKDKSFIRSDHILPHFSKADIILCKDKKTGAFVEPMGFQNYIIGDIKRPFYTERYTWYSLVIVNINLITRNENSPLGTVLMKQQQLKTIGYTPILLTWTNYGSLTPDQQLSFLSNSLAINHTTIA